MNHINKLDLKITKFIYNTINSNDILKSLPHIFGLLPYEIYVIPGMFLAILQVLLINSYNPIQFHLLPHWFAYSFFQFIKKAVDRGRPGCVNKSLGKYINPGHCKGSSKFESFPSGHMGVASSLAAALYMEMNYSKSPSFFSMKINSDYMKKIISRVGIFVAAMVGVHRISKGYHSFFDVVIGFIFGMAIGLVSWKILEECDTKEIKETETRHESTSSNKEELHANNAITASKIILIFPVLYLFYKFVKKDLHNLTDIRH
jgi:membrane-associated phospholipid phosphatase